MKEESDHQKEDLLAHARKSQTPINRIDGPNRDQLFRLSSYMLEHNRNIKILIEKHNYLLKLREGGTVSEEEKRVIETTQALLGDTRRLEEVRRAVGGVDWTLGGGHDSDNDSSEIEEEKNGVFSS